MKRLSIIFYAVWAVMNISTYKKSSTSNINLSHWDYANNKLSERGGRIVLLGLSELLVNSQSCKMLTKGITNLLAECSILILSRGKQ